MQENNLQMYTSSEQRGEALCKASIRGDIKTIRSIVESIKNQGVSNPDDIVFENGYGLTPFHFAVLAKQEGSIRTLIELGFDVDVMSIYECDCMSGSETEIRIQKGTTPLELAVQLNQTALAKLFIENNGTIRKKLTTPIGELVQEIHSNIGSSTPLPDVLIEEVAEYAYFPENEDSNIPICMNCSVQKNINLYEFITNTTTPKEFEIFCLKNRDTYQVTDGGHVMGLTALHLASRLGNVDLMDKIFKMGGSEIIDLGSDCGITPLHMAVIGENIQSAEKLIALGAQVNLATNQSFIPFFSKKATPLWLAIEGVRNLSLVKLFLKNGGLVGLPLSEEGQQLLEQAKKENAEE